MMPGIDLTPLGYKRRNGPHGSYWELPPEKIEELRRNRLARAPGCIRSRLK